MKSITRAAGALALTGLLASSALAAESGPLAAGKPAGVKEAALGGRPTLIWLGVAAIVAITIAVVASDNDNTVTPTTTGTAS